jgi:hypothetical protein
MTASGGFGRWGWSGQCAPGSGVSAGVRRFSVGVWPRDEDGKKTGPAVVRVEGESKYPVNVYETANRCCNHLNVGDTFSPAAVAGWFKRRVPLGVSVRLTKAGREAS